MAIHDGFRRSRGLKLVAAAAILALLAAGAAVAVRQDGAAPTPAPRPIVSIQEIMLSQIDASADKIWASAGSISDERGFRDLAPTTEAEWEALRAATITLAEAPNLLAQEGRPLVRPGVKIQDQGLEGIAPPEAIARALVAERPVFLSRARDLQTVANKALVAIDRRDPKALEAAGAELDAACEACHQHFWYPPKPKA